MQPDEDGNGEEDDDDAEYNANVEAAQEALELRRAKEEADTAGSGEATAQQQPPSNDLLGLNLNDPGSAPNGDSNDLLGGLASVANTAEQPANLANPSQAGNNSSGTADLLGGF